MSEKLGLPELKAVKAVESNTTCCCSAFCNFWKGLKLVNAWKVSKRVILLKIYVEVENLLHKTT